MCFTCPPALVVAYETVEVVYERIADPVTRLGDIDEHLAHVAAHEAREWLYVALRATVRDASGVRASATLHGVTEGLERECAFADAAALDWVGGEAIRRALAALTTP